MTLLRPPGAEPERLFRARCIQCGQCAQQCPFHAITMDAGLNPLTAGTPWVDSSSSPCFLCMKCGNACPSGALKPVTQDKANMGLAVLDRDSCFTWGGVVLCRTCYEKCPLRGKALVLQNGINPVITESCVGCGVCEFVCPRKAVTTVPERELAKRRAKGS